MMRLRFMVAVLGLAVAACGGADSYAIDVEVIVPAEVQAELSAFPQQLVLRGSENDDRTVEFLRTLCESSGEDVVVEWHRAEVHDCGPNWTLEAWIEAVPGPQGDACNPAKQYADAGDAPADDAPRASVVTFEGETGCPTGRDFLRLRLATP